MYEKILLALDGSDNSIRAVKKVIEFQKEWDCKVVLFHSIKHPININMVSIMPLAAPYYSSTFVEVKQENLNIEWSKMILKQAKNMFNEVNLPVSVRLIKDEMPEDYIERIVEEEDFDLVVLGFKGYHSKLRENVIGSVTQKVVRYSSCDVFIIK